MKASALRKRSAMSLVNTATQPADDYHFRPTVQPKSNQRRLRVVAPQVTSKPGLGNYLTGNAALYSAILQQRLRSLTTEDVVKVNLATVREGSNPRYWPTDVVERFLTAEVVKH